MTERQEMPQQVFDKIADYMESQGQTIYSFINAHADELYSNGLHEEAAPYYQFVLDHNPEDKYAINNHKLNEKHRNAGEPR